MSAAREAAERILSFEARNTRGPGINVVVAAALLDDAVSLARAYLSLSTPASGEVEVPANVLAAARQAMREPMAGAPFNLTSILARWILSLATPDTGTGE